MPEISIRQATLEDTEFLVQGNAAMALETEARALDPHLLSAGVRALFADPNRGFYLIAELAGRPAGQMMITYEWSDWRNAQFWWIQSVYTLPESRRRGVFQSLYAYVDAQARHRANVCGLRLYVESHNHHAQAVYHRCGMREAVYRMYELDYSTTPQPATRTI